MHGDGLNARQCAVNETRLMPAEDSCTANALRTAATRPSFCHWHQHHRCLCYFHFHLQQQEQRALKNKSKDLKILWPAHMAGECEKEHKAGLALTHQLYTGRAWPTTISWEHYARLTAHDKVTRPSAYTYTSKQRRAGAIVLRSETRWFQGDIELSFSLVPNTLPWKPWLP